MAAKPDTPPKYSQIFSTISAVWGMFDPPDPANLAYRSTAEASIFLREFFRLARARLESCRTLALWQDLHSELRPSRLQRKKCSASCGNVLPQWRHG